MKKYKIILFCILVIIIYFPLFFYQNYEKYNITTNKAEAIETKELVLLALSDNTLYNYAVASASIFQYPGVVEHAAKTHPYLLVLIQRPDSIDILNSIEPINYKATKNKQVLLWYLTQTRPAS